MNSFYLRVKTGEAAKVVISVSKKVSKKATVRNLIKRRIRPIVKDLMPGLKSAEYFIVARPGADKVKGETLRRELAELFKKS
jgi:ribonuclease P protein component